MIEVKHLTKRYGDRTAVNDLSFKIYGGKIYGLLGPNGAGKSTTMNMMTGCLAPTSGTVRINGFDIFEQERDAKQLMGYLPEQPPLYVDMTPEEYLTFIAEAKRVSPDRVQKQVEEALALTDLTDVKDRLIKHLSKGYCQRVGIAQAILGDPEIVILDEPTVGLDPKQIFDVRALIRRLGERRTVIVSSHILAEIAELCDELLVIAGGTLVASGTLEELEAMVADGTEELLLSVRGDAAGVLAVLEKVEGVRECRLTGGEMTGDTVDVTVCLSRGQDVRDAIFFALADSRYAVLRMEQRQQTLERVFLTLTQSTAEEASTSHVPSEPDEEQQEAASADLTRESKEEEA